MSRLAAAHRGAVRALQTFVSQAPLQPKVGHGLPPMYQELSALIRQLSLLATQLHIGGEDLSDEVKGMENEGGKVSEPYTSTLLVCLTLQDPTQNPCLELLNIPCLFLLFIERIWFASHVPSKSSLLSS